MQELEGHYKAHVAAYGQQLKKMERRLFLFSMVRLGVFLLGVVGSYFLWEYPRLVIGLVLLTVGGFLFLVSKYTNLKYEKLKLAVLQEMVLNEVKIGKGEFHHMPDGAEYKEANHFLPKIWTFSEKGPFSNISIERHWRGGSLFGRITQGQ